MAVCLSSASCTGKVLRQGSDRQLTPPYHHQQLPGDWTGQVWGPVQKYVGNFGLWEALSLSHTCLCPSPQLCRKPFVLDGTFLQGLAE